MGFFGKRKSAKQQLYERTVELGALTSMPVQHIEGLPIAQFSHCNIFLKTDGVVFEQEDKTLNIGIDQITNATIRNWLPGEVKTLDKSKSGKLPNFYLYIEYISKDKENRTVILNCLANYECTKFADKIRQLKTDNLSKNIYL